MPEIMREIRRYMIEKRFHFSQMMPMSPPAPRRGARRAILDAIQSLIATGGTNACRHTHVAHNIRASMELR